MVLPEVPEDCGDGAALGAPSGPLPFCGDGATGVHPWLLTRRCWHVLYPQPVSDGGHPGAA